MQDDDENARNKKKMNSCFLPDIEAAAKTELDDAICDRDVCEMFA